MVGCIAVACVTTSLSIGALVLTAGLFAAPALATTALTFAFLSIPSVNDSLSLSGYLFSHAVIFALFSTIAIVVGIALGILAPALVTTFIIASTIITALLLGAATYSLYKEKKSMETNLSFSPFHAIENRKYGRWNVMFFKAIDRD